MGQWDKVLKHCAEDEAVLVSCTSVAVGGKGELVRRFPNIPDKLLSLAVLHQDTFVSSANNPDAGTGGAGARYSILDPKAIGARGAEAYSGLYRLAFNVVDKDGGIVQTLRLGWAQACDWEEVRIMAGNHYPGDGGANAQECMHVLALPGVDPSKVEEIRAALLASPVLTDQAVGQGLSAFTLAGEWDLIGVEPVQADDGSATLQLTVAQPDVTWTTFTSWFSAGNEQIVTKTVPKREAQALVDAWKATAGGGASATIAYDKGIAKVTLAKADVTTEGLGSYLSSINKGHYRYTTVYWGLAGADLGRYSLEAQAYYDQIGYTLDLSIEKGQQPGYFNLAFAVTQTRRQALASYTAEVVKGHVTKIQEVKGSVSENALTLPASGTVGVQTALHKELADDGTVSLRKTTRETKQQTLPSYTAEVTKGHVTTVEDLQGADPDDEDTPTLDEEEGDPEVGVQTALHKELADDGTVSLRKTTRETKQQTLAEYTAEVTKGHVTKIQEVKGAKDEHTVTLDEEEEDPEVGVQTALHKELADDGTVALRKTTRETKQQALASYTAELSEGHIAIEEVVQGAQDPALITLDEEKEGTLLELHKEIATDGTVSFRSRSRAEREQALASHVVFKSKYREITREEKIAALPEDGLEEPGDAETGKTVSFKKERRDSGREDTAISEETRTPIVVEGSYLVGNNHGTATFKSVKWGTRAMFADDLAALTDASGIRNVVTHDADEDDTVSYTITKVPSDWQLDNEWLGTHSGTFHTVETDKIWDETATPMRYVRKRRTVSWPYTFRVTAMSRLTAESYISGGYKPGSGVVAHGSGRYACTRIGEPEYGAWVSDE